jgi:hypothetical protein
MNPESEERRRDAEHEASPVGFIVKEARALYGTGGFVGGGLSASDAPRDVSQAPSTIDVVCNHCGVVGESIPPA